MVSTMELYTLGRILELEPALRRGWTYPKVTKDWASKRWAKAPMLAALVGDAPAPAGPRRREAAEDGRRGDVGLPPAGQPPAWPGSRKLAGVELIAWTVDDLARMRKLVDAGVDGICSNDPRLFRSTRPL